MDSKCRNPKFGIDRKLNDHPLRIPPLQLESCRKGTYLIHLTSKTVIIKFKIQVFCKYPKCDPFNKVLIAYAELECEVLYGGQIPLPDEEEKVTNRIWRILYKVLSESEGKTDNLLSLNVRKKTEIEICIIINQIRVNRNGEYLCPKENYVVQYLNK